MNMIISGKTPLTGGNNELTVKHFVHFVVFINFLTSESLLPFVSILISLTFSSSSSSSENGTILIK